MPCKCFIFLVRAGGRQQLWKTLEGIRRQGLPQLAESRCAGVMTPRRLALWQEKRTEALSMVPCERNAVLSGLKASLGDPGEGGGGERAAREMD